MSTFYRDRMEKHLDMLSHLIPAALHTKLVEDYRSIYQEIRNDVCADLQRMTAQDRAIERQYGVEAEQRRIAEVLGLESLL